MVFNLNRIYVGILILSSVLLFYFSKLDLIFFFFIFFLSIFEIFKNNILNIKFTFIFSIIGFFLIYSSSFFQIDILIIIAYLISFFLVFLKDSFKNFFFALVIFLFFINLFMVLDNNRDLFYLIIFISFYNDTIAYIFGNLLGGRKITPLISPNKTWSNYCFFYLVIYIYLFLFKLSYIHLLTNVYLSFFGIYFFYNKKKFTNKRFLIFKKSWRYT